MKLKQGVQQKEKKKKKANNDNDDDERCFEISFQFFISVVGARAYERQQRHNIFVKPTEATI